MKKTIFTLLIACLIFPFVNAQETTEETREYKWQARVRLISVIPVADDDIFGHEVNISHAFVPELDFTYFFTKNFAAELILGTAKHDVEVERPGFPTTDLGHVWLLPPTLNFQYHFTGGAAKPYIGAGVNYTFFYSIDEGDVAGMEYEDTFGFSLQGGLDYSLNDKWFLNLDFKKLYLNTDVEVDTGAGVLPVEVDINPWILGVGFGMKF